MNEIFTFLNENTLTVQALATLILVIVTVYYAISTHRLANTSVKQAAAAEKMVKLTYDSAFRPILVFRNLGDHCWRLCNAGNAPAINVLVCEGDVHKNWKKETAMLLYTIPPKEEIQLEWMKLTGALLATYVGVDKMEYTSVCVHNRNTLSKENCYPDLKPAYFQFQITEMMSDRPVHYESET